VTHEADPWTSALLPTGLELAAEALRLLHAIEGPRPANLWLHAAGHWHIEVVPRFGILAGIELGAGLAINPLPAEHAATALRAARGR
jgi:galactose-1-phosphate uridylyltransferase